MKINENLTHRAYQDIKQMMFDHKLVPGQRLISVDLAQQLGISRTPINNALNILASEGIVDLVPNQGYRVHEITREEAESLWQIREILEIGSIEYAIKCLTPKKIKELKKQKTSYEKAVWDPTNRDRFSLDEEFHVTYIKMTGNIYLPDYFREIHHRVFLRQRIEALKPDRAKKALAEHDQIFRSICDGDLKSAKRNIKAHIKAGKEYILSVQRDNWPNKI
jgi:DNA-binding GntR family transcriptional regulator